MDLQHLAIIMDGNRRWAEFNGLSPHEGHRMGAKNLWSIIQKTNNLGIKYLTIFGFSTENWKRSSLEINFLMGLLSDFLDDSMLKINEYNFKIKFIGDLNVFDKSILEKMCLNSEDILLCANGEECLNNMQEYTKLAIQKGVFGSPYVIVDDEPFWGADRLEQVREWLRTGGF